MLQRCRHAKHDVVVLRIAAPEEEEFPFEKPTQFRDLEVSQNRLLVDPLRLRNEYLRQYREFEKTLSHECGMLGIDYRRLLTSDPLQNVMGSWLAERSAAQKGRC